MFKGFKGGGGVGRGEQLPSQRFYRKKKNNESQ
jgi:hypothetical protein